MQAFAEVVLYVGVCADSTIPNNTQGNTFIKRKKKAPNVSTKCTDKNKSSSKLENTAAGAAC